MFVSVLFKYRALIFLNFGHFLEPLVSSWLLVWFLRCLRLARKNLLVHNNNYSSLIIQHLMNVTPPAAHHSSALVDNYICRNVLHQYTFAVCRALYLRTCRMNFNLWRSKNNDFCHFLRKVLHYLFIFRALSFKMVLSIIIDYTFKSNMGCTRPK